jgi:hypothetical protein
VRSGRKTRHRNTPLGNIQPSVMNQESVWSDLLKDTSTNELNEVDLLQFLDVDVNNFMGMNLLNMAATSSPTISTFYPSPNLSTLSSMSLPISPSDDLCQQQSLPPFNSAFLQRTTMPPMNNYTFERPYPSSDLPMRTTRNRKTDPMSPPLTPHLANKDGKIPIDQLNPKPKPSPAQTEEMHVCPHPGCNKAFPRYYSLKSHLLCHSNERPHVCSACHAAFARKHDLQRHLRTLHNGTLLISNASCRKSSVQVSKVSTGLQTSHLILETSFGRTAGTPHKLIC